MKINQSVIQSITLSTLLLGSSITTADVGIAFVHGTGTNTNAKEDYWDNGFVDSVIGGTNGIKHIITSCNFDNYMWAGDAAGCLADHLHRFINDEDINALHIITHSFGGTVVRWILSNPTWDSRYPTIIESTQQVIALAPSSLGTPLADAAINGDVFEQLLGWILNVGSNAVEMQQVANMAYYNSNWLYGTAGRPQLPVVFKTVVGTDVDSNVFDLDSYCGGIEFQAALEVTREWLDDCSDGFIECESQAGAGTVWFYDHERTEGQESLSHQQSRRPCFKLDNIISTDIRG